MTVRGFKWRLLLVCVGAYAVALAMLHGTAPRDVQHESLRINGPEDRPCVGTLWTPPHPVAVVVLGHGITGNQGVMATLAKCYADNGYAAVALDFWGHGLSQEPFAMLSNPSQLHAWFAWARDRFPALPLVYLGYSMGGVSGELAVRQGATMDAYISMGMLPRRIPEFPTLIAAGRFEELFTPEQARRRANGQADVLISPLSNHVLEAVDPVLIHGMVRWTDEVLGHDRDLTVSTARYVALFLGVILGFAASLALAACALLPLRRQTRPGEAPEVARAWSVNPYRLAGRILRCKGQGAPPRSAAPWHVLCLQGMLFFLVFIVLLSFIFVGHVYSYALFHPWRWLTWLLVLVFVVPAILLDVWALERLALNGVARRFLVTSLTRCIPLLALAIGLRYVPGMSFFGMTLGLWALIFMIMSLVHALATRGAGDYRAGAVASMLYLAWVVAFFSPQLLG